MPSQAESVVVASSSSSSSMSSTSRCAGLFGRSARCQRRPVAIDERQAAWRSRASATVTISAMPDSGAPSDQRRRVQQRVAEHAAEAGRQRPGVRCAAATRRKRRPGSVASDPDKAAPFRADRPMRQQPPAQQRDRQQQQRPRRGRTAASAGRRRSRRRKPSRLCTGACVAWLSEGPAPTRSRARWRRAAPA